MDLGAMDSRWASGAGPRDHGNHPATYGFPLPAPGYLEAVKELCEPTARSTLPRCRPG